MNGKLTRDDILNKLTSILVEDFEVDKNLITLDASLFEDLDLDSIDAVDFSVSVQQFTLNKILL